MPINYKHITIFMRTVVNREGEEKGGEVSPTAKGGSCAAEEAEVQALSEARRKRGGTANIDGDPTDHAEEIGDSEGFLRSSWLS